MVLEVAILDVKPRREKAFETAFCKAEKIISSVDGYVSHKLPKCVQRCSRYILLVNWQELEDHTVGFRGSEQYQEWSRLLYRFYEQVPEVEHYVGISRVAQ